jgi:hypothetical protein
VGVEKEEGPKTSIIVIICVKPGLDGALLVE